MRVEAGNARSGTTTSGPPGAAVTPVTVQRSTTGWQATIGGDPPFDITVEPLGSDDDELVVTVDGIARRYLVADVGDRTWLGAGGAAWAMHVEHRWRSGTAGRAVEADGLLTSPMPGTVLDVRVAVGDAVVVGQTLATVEAMKMEHPLNSRIDGVVAELHAQPGQPVALGDQIVRVVPAPNPEVEQP